jgi:hypothetical protein
MSTPLATPRDAGLLISTWDVRRSALSASVQTQSSKSKIASKSKKKAATFVPKKYRPPHPMGVKGGCSPQNNLRKLLTGSKRGFARWQQNSTQNSPKIFGQF